MRLGIAAYWLSLADQEPIAEGEGAAESVAVSVAKRNFLNVDALPALLTGDLSGATRD